MSSEVIMTEEASTPATPATGRSKLYFKTDSKLYKLDDAGVETEIGAAVGLSVALAIALG